MMLRSQGFPEPARHIRRHAIASIAGNPLQSAPGRPISRTLCHYDGRNACAPELLKSVSPFAEVLKSRVVATEAPPLTPSLFNTQGADCGCADGGSSRSRALFPFHLPISTEPLTPAAVRGPPFVQSPASGRLVAVLFIVSIGVASIPIFDNRFLSINDYYDNLARTAVLLHYTDEPNFPLYFLPN